MAQTLRGNLLLPTTYTPINGDLNVQLQYFSQEKRSTPINLNSDESASSSSEEFDIFKTTSAPAHSKPRNDDVRLQISHFIGTNRTTVAILDVYPDPRLNTTQITISCLNFLFGGTYELEIVGGNDVDEDANTLDTHDERLRQQLDVRWPQPKLSVTPESIGTYPQQPVDVILEFPGIECAVQDTKIDRVPEFWLELYFCGHEVYCDSTNVSSSQVLFAEQIRGFPKARLIKLSCELFGLAGHYVVKLRPIGSVAASVSATAYIQVNHNQFQSICFSSCNAHIYAQSERVKMEMDIGLHCLIQVFPILVSILACSNLLFIFSFIFCSHISYHTTMHHSHIAHNKCPQSNLNVKSVKRISTLLFHLISVGLVRLCDVHLLGLCVIFL